MSRCQKEHQTFWFYVEKIFSDRRALTSFWKSRSRWQFQHICRLHPVSSAITAKKVSFIARWAHFDAHVHTRAHHPITARAINRLRCKNGYPQLCDTCSHRTAIFGYLIPLESGLFWRRHWKRSVWRRSGPIMSNKTTIVGNEEINLAPHCNHPSLRHYRCPVFAAELRLLLPSPHSLYASSSWHQLGRWTDDPAAAASRQIDDK